jgi:hypothetical protein
MIEFVPKSVLVFAKKLRWVINTIPYLCIVILFSSCNNYPDPSEEYLENYTFYQPNISQIARAGEYLDDSIFVQVYNMISEPDVIDFKVEFQVNSGGGTVDHQQVLTDGYGMAITMWKMGSESLQQSIIARIFDPHDKFLSEINFYAYSIIPNSWNDVDFAPLSRLSDMAADTINDVTWMISYNRIYKRGDNFLDWIEQENTYHIQTPREIGIDRNGVIYIGTWNGELYKSADQGQSWIKCTNPIPNRPYYFYFWITYDGDLWATAPEYGTWRSTDGGTTWTNPFNFFINGVSRLSNGDLISMFDNPHISVMKSEDDGVSWSELVFPSYPSFFFVTENDEIIVGIQGASVGLYKSTDFGQLFTKVSSVPVTFGTTSLQTNCHKFEAWYYFIVPGYGALKTQDFEQFETIFNEPNINGIYVDHTGSIAVKGWLEKLNHTFYYNNE